METSWYSKSISEIFDAFSTSETGLSCSEAKARFEKYGPNKLPEGKRPSLFSIFLRQFRSPLVYILFGAALIVFVIGESTDTLIIISVLVFNAIVGTVQEGRAQNTLSVLKKFSETAATVLRDGKTVVVSDTDIVPGDVIFLQEGEKIPADARVFLSRSLQVNEASLTGESEPVLKVDAALSEHHGEPVEQKNMVFKGTYVVSGSGTAVVLATGIGTRIGQIAKEIVSIDTEVPLKKSIRYLSRLIIITVAGISATLLLLGVLSGTPLKEMFTVTVALSVSIIPEGLPIVMTLVLATGVWRMSRRQALVKRLQAVEALGQTQVIAVDKTGTLTKNEMVVQRIYTGSKTFSVTGESFESTGELLLEGTPIDPLNHAELLLVGKISAFCANARPSYVPETNTWKVAGDPTEAAMVVLSEKIGFKQDVLEHESPRLSELPFDYRQKYHASVHQVAGKNFLAVAGAPESVINLCEKIWIDGTVRLFGKQKKEEIESAFKHLAREGFRVVALAMHQNIGRQNGLISIPPLIFVGFLGMRDPLRPEVHEAIGRVKAARMRVVMITGDHRLTAEAIAKEAGIFKEGDQVLTGEEIEQLSPTDLAKEISRTSVFARVTPESKLRIIQAYRARGEVVAMTGDGVNDAPSLVAADLGVAMGNIGTEVAKEAADIVLLNDNFATIVAAVEEGRSIYKTIKKVILYLFSTSIGEVFTIAGAIMLGYGLPILPAQIIWLNFVTDGFLDVSLAMEPKERGLLQVPFRRPRKWIVDRLMVQRMVFMALPMAIGTLFLFKKYFEMDFTKALTVSLTTLAVFQWFNAWNCRSEEKSIFQINPFSNLFLLGATVLVILLQVAALYTPFLQRVLHTEPLLLREWFMIIPVAASILLVEETRKLIVRTRKKRTHIIAYPLVGK